MANVPKEIKEMNVNFVDSDDMASVTVYQAKYVKQIKALAEKHPDEVKMIAGDDGKNSGMHVFHLPKKYCHISFGDRTKAKREMTEEQMEAARARAKKMQEAKRAKAEAKKMEEENWL